MKMASYSNMGCRFIPVGVGTGLDSGRNECGVKTDPQCIRKTQGRHRTRGNTRRKKAEMELFFSELDRLETDTEFHEDT